MGDFNAVTNAAEKKGGRQFGNKSSSDFNEFIISNGFHDAGYLGNKFTWSNNQKGLRCIWMRLDRVLLNGIALNKFPDLKVTHLPRVQSDHCPILLEFANNSRHKTCFSFNPAWANHPGFLELVKKHWGDRLHVNPMCNVHLKLKALRLVFRSWNWNIFGDFNQKINELSNKIESTEQILQVQSSIDGEKDLVCLHKLLNSSLKDRQSFLNARSHVSWLQNGDSNTGFFHAALKVRRSYNNFKVTLPSGDLSDDPIAKGEMAIQYFEDLLGGFSNVSDTDYFQDISPSITSSDNEMLCGPPTKEEIHSAILSLPNNSAPGPDGFTGEFFSKAWDIIAKDLIEAVLHFFKGFQIPHAISSTVLTLIPKEQNVTSLDKVRPISLCNFLHKILSKILNDRLLTVIDKVISKEQFGFLPGRSIHQCIGLAHDLTSDINKKVHGGNIMVKLDMSKAYDRLSWHFLIKSMKAFGFSEEWCDLIYRNISNCWYSIRLNGISYGYFKSNRGVRQGDPLSPSLFILAMEILSRKLNKAGARGGGLMPYWTSLKAKEINHIFYADDILVFSNGGKSSFSTFLAIMHNFCLQSGQVIQPSKSKLYFSKHINGIRKNDLLHLSGYAEGLFPVKYLGVPLFFGPPRIIYFNDLVERIKNRIQGWMKSFLNMAGRLTLITSVLQSIPVHCLAVIPAPKGTLKAIDRLIRSFLWDNGLEKRRHWVNWDTICQPQEYGGLGIRPLHQSLIGLQGKMAWNYLLNDSLWAQHARSRFSLVRRGSHLWNSLIPFINDISLNCHWSVGKGNTTIDIFCGNLGIPIPKSLKYKSIKEVLTSDNLRRFFVQNINPRVLSSLVREFSSHPDKIIWNGDPSGVVTTKSYLKHAFNATSSKRFDYIWHPWLPRKISVFLWRMLYNSLPTQDNVMKAGISMANKCICCSQPHYESMDHIFIYSDIAKVLYDCLCPIFRRSRPDSVHHLLYDWGSIKHPRFPDMLGFAILSGCLWDIWKVRNSFIYDDHAVSFGRHTILRWAAYFSAVIPITHSMDNSSGRICELLHLSPRFKDNPEILWLQWQPCSKGNTCNVSISIDAHESRMAAIIRNVNGFFVAGYKVGSTRKSFTRCLFQVFNDLRHHGIPFTCLRVSHKDILLLGKVDRIDWSDFAIRNRLRKDLRHTDIFLVSNSLNRPANALCKIDSATFFNQRSLLPAMVRSALLMDSGMHPCSFKEQKIIIA